MTIEARNRRDIYDLEELLTVEEFAKRMKISRTTVFDWIKKGRLKAGRHYIQIGRVIRFEWGPELVQALYEDSAVLLEEAHSRSATRRRKKNKKRRGGNGHSVINLDY
jgi:excisionase family DNA binding protein